MRPGTERIAALVEVLGHPQRSYPVIHVAGTNGKFSVVAIATSILTELGITTGTYTSPDLGLVRERIGFALEPIDEEGFAAVLTYLIPYVEMVEERMGDQMTYFELLTAMAFEAFFDRAVHTAVVEAGLGGEYDATNVADAKVGVLTNVTMDHVRQFGGDLVKAAWEKAGIAKEGTTLVTGVEDDGIFDVVARRATEKGASSVVRLGSEIALEERKPAVGGQLISVRGLHGTYEDVFVALFGEHQARNAALAVAACEAFAEAPLNDESLRRGLAEVRTPGRMEVLQRRPLVVCDGGHNPASAETVRDAVAESFSYRRLILVVGMLSEKLIDEVMALWAGVVDEAIVTAPQTDRAADPERLREALRSAGLAAERIQVQSGVTAAIDTALDIAEEEDLVLVFGSFYTVGEARAHVAGR